jgi:hypothetical protein
MTYTERLTPEITATVNVFNGTTTNEQLSATLNRVIAEHNIDKSKWALGLMDYSNEANYDIAVEDALACDYDIEATVQFRYHPEATK